MKIILVLVALVAATSAKAVDSHVADHHQTDDYHTTTPAYTAPAAYGYKDTYAHAPAHYKYDYAVKDDYYNNYGAEESREGDSTKGSYFVDLPDGRRLVVTYYVNGDSGFVADVKYEGEIKPYEAKPYEHKAPAYKKPDPVYHAEPAYHAEPVKVADYHHPADHKVDYHPEPVHHVADHHHH